MKKHIGLSATVAALLFFGCQRLDDILQKDNLVVNGCAIATVHIPANFEFDGSDAYTATFSYNAHGQPERIVYDRQSQTGYPNNFLFRYDAKNRLTDLIATYDNSTFESWSVFFYNSKGQIVLDSVFIFGNLDGEPPSQSDEDLLAFNVYFTYDEQGRIRQVINDHYPSSTDPEVDPYKDTSNYAYNGDGNLVRENSTYDTKVNMNRTNKIWMFMNRDYSRNNFRAAVSYNKKGLPLAFTASPIPFALYEFHEDASDAKTDNVQITYTCTDSND